MPKMKTNSAAKKRFRRLKSGAIKRGKAYKRHLLKKKSEKRKRRLRTTGYICKADSKRVKKLLPYSG